MIHPHHLSSYQPSKNSHPPQRTSHTTPFRQAEDAYLAMQRYIFKANQEYADLEGTIQHLGIEALRETRVNRDTHLINAFRLSFDSKVTDAIYRCYLAVRLLCFRARSVDRNTHAFLLMQGEERGGNTPLHWILRLGSKDCLVLYFQEARDAIVHRWIPPEDYGRLLIRANQTGHTPLHQVLHSRNRENIILYFQEVHDAVRRQWISYDDYRNLLTHAYVGGFTPLHQVAKDGDLAMVQIVLGILEKALPLEDFLAALSRKTEKGYLPTCTSSSPDGKAINDLIDHKWQSAKDYQRALRDQARERSENGHYLSNNSHGYGRERDNGGNIDYPYQPAHQ